MSFGGIVAAGLAGGVEGAGAGMATGALEQMKEDAIKARDEALAKMADQQAVTKANRDIENIPRVEKAKSDAAAATRAQDDAGVQSKALAEATGRNAAPPSAETVSNNESNRLHRQSLEADSAARLRLEEDRATMAHNDRADRQAGAAAGAADKDQATKDAAEAKLKPSWDKTDDSNVKVESKTGWREVTDEGKPGRPAGTGIFGTGIAAKDAVPLVPPTTKYYDKAGKERTIEELYAEIRKQGRPEDSGPPPKRSALSNSIQDAAETRTPEQQLAAARPAAPGSTISTTSEGIPYMKPPAGAASPHGDVVRRGVDKQGNRVVQYSDGTVGPE